MSLRDRVNEWRQTMAGRSLVLQTPAGEVVCCSAKPAYQAAVDRGEVALSPLELVELLEAREQGVDLLTGEDGERKVENGAGGGGSAGGAGSVLAGIVAVKRWDAGARVVAVESMAAEDEMGEVPF